MEKVTVSPTLSEAFHYANLSGQWLWTILGIVLFVILCIVIWALKTDRLEMRTGIGWGMLVLGAGFIACVFGKPTAISLSNDKVVTKAHYEKVGKKYILDSVFNANRMINAAKK